MLNMCFLSLQLSILPIGRQLLFRSQFWLTILHQTQQIIPSLYPIVTLLQLPILVPGMYNSVTFPTRHITSISILVLSRCNYVFFPNRHVYLEGIFINLNNMFSTLPSIVTLSFIVIGIENFILTSQWIRYISSPLQY